MKKVLKKGLTWLLVAVMVFPFFGVFDLTISLKASALSGILWPVPSSYHISCRYKSGHTAIDIDFCERKDIVAAYDGTVYRYWNKCTHISSSCTSCDPDTKFGVGLILKHNINGTTYYTYYGHMVYDSVPSAYRTVGAPVKQGDVIGTVGSSGNSTGYHCHFSLSTGVWSGYINNMPTDSSKHTESDSGGISYIYSTQHVHDYNTLLYYQTAHPHYAVYQCSCGATQVNYNETQHSASCDTCIANLKAPTLTINKTTAVVGESITITWPDDTGANSYWVNVIYNGEILKDGYSDTRTSYTFTASKEGAYGFSVIALIDSNVGKHSVVWVNYIPELKAPVLSVDKTTAVVGESITITWPDDTGANSYWVNVIYNGEILKDGYADTRTAYTFTASKEGAYGFSVIAISDDHTEKNSVVWVNYINNVLDNIVIQTTPQKTSYYVGDTLNTTGLTLTANYNGGSTQAVNTGFTCTPTTLLSAGTQTITVSYGGKTATFTVTVVPVTLSGISVKNSPTKTAYFVGDTLNTVGLTLTVTYNNGSTAVISNGFTCTPTTLSVAGTQAITVNYNGKTAMFNVTVNEKPVDNITAIQITKPSDTLTYKASMNCTVAVTPSNAANYKVSWSSSNTNVAVVDGSGKVTAVGTGKATITATVKNEGGTTVSNSATVTVRYAWWQWLIKIMLLGWIWY